MATHLFQKKDRATEFASECRSKGLIAVVAPIKHSDKRYKYAVYAYRRKPGELY